MNLNDLPDEVLCTIFDHLDVYELKVASLVCRRWCELTFSGSRMDRVLLVKRDCNCEFLFNTKRNYRNVRQPWVRDGLESLVRLLHAIKPHVRMLDIDCVVTSEQLRSILLEVPAIQHLSLGFVRFNCNKNATFPVLPKLKSLVLNGSTNDCFFSSFTHIANVQSLEMDCCTDLQLEAWTYFSRQLKLVHVQEFDTRYLHPFLELTFPRLEDLDIVILEFSKDDVMDVMDLERTSGFFRRHPFLRRLSLHRFFMVEWFQIISHHCHELTHLSCYLMDPEDGFLESLVQLNKLKHLSLDGEVDRKILRGPMKSLESVELEMIPHRVLLENLFEVVPRLRCLRIMEFISCEDLHFICEKFTCLRRLELYIDDEVPILAHDSVRFDRLEHLQELKISDNIRIRSIHRNTVRCMTITQRSACFVSRSGIMDRDLEWIPQKFPLLNRLILEECSVPLAAVEQLHRLVPLCRIDYDNKRFYPILDAPAK